MRLLSFRGEVSRRDGKEEFAPNVRSYVEAPSWECDRSGGLAPHVYRYVCET